MKDPNPGVELLPRLTLFHMPTVWILFFSTLYVLLPSVTTQFLYLYLDLPVSFQTTTQQIHTIGFAMIAVGSAVALLIDIRVVRFLNTRVITAKGHFLRATAKTKVADLWLVVAVTLPVLVLIALLSSRIGSGNRLSRLEAVHEYAAFVSQTKFLYFVMLLQFTSLLLYLKYGKYRFLLPLLLLLGADYIQGGRSLSLQALMLVALVVSFRAPRLISFKTIVVWASIMALVIAVPALSRFASDAKDISTIYARSFSELYTSYWGASAYIESRHVSGHPYISMLAQVFSALTFINLGDALTADHFWYQHAANFAGSDFGLTANPVAEAVYYFGAHGYGAFLFLAFAPVAISGFIMFLVRVFLVRQPLRLTFAILIVLVSMIQNMIRTGFFSGIIDMLRAIVVCFLFYSILFGVRVNRRRR